MGGGSSGNLCHGHEISNDHHCRQQLQRSIVHRPLVESKPRLSSCVSPGRTGDFLISDLGGGVCFDSTDKNDTKVSVKGPQRGEHLDPPKFGRDARWGGAVLGDSSVDRWGG